jgi:hypothetical protein
MLLVSEQREPNESSPSLPLLFPQPLPRPHSFHSSHKNAFLHPLHSPTLIHSSKMSIRAIPNNPKALFTLSQKHPGVDALHRLPRVAKGPSKRARHTFASLPRQCSAYTQELLQPLCAHAPAHSFVHTGGVGVPLALPFTPSFEGPARAHTNPRNSCPLMRLLHSSLYTPGYTPPIPHGCRAHSYSVGAKATGNAWRERIAGCCSIAREKWKEGMKIRIERKANASATSKRDFSLRKPTISQEVKWSKKGVGLLRSK